MASHKAWAVIAGVGSGTGSSVARRFAKSYSVALLARNQSNLDPIVKEINDAGGRALGITADTSDASSVKAAFEQLKKEIASESGQSEPRIAAAVYNVGGGLIRKPFVELTEQEVEGGWVSNGRGAAFFSQAAIPLLLAQAGASPSPEYPPTLIFTSATAALKANPRSASFASGKFALRAIAQSLAKELGPQGIHVVHAIIDGVIDIPKSKGYLADVPEAKIDPVAIADTYWFLHTQPRTAFTNELDIRPAIEKW